MLHSIILLVFVAVFSVFGFVFYQNILGWVYPHVVFTNESNLLLSALFNTLAFFSLAVTIVLSYFRNIKNGVSNLVWFIVLLVVGLGVMGLVLGYMRADLVDIQTSAEGFGPVRMSAENIKIYLAPLASIFALAAITFGKEVLTRRKVIR